MAANPYDLVRYPTFPQFQTHPDRLAAVGRLFGMNPAPVEACRVLEIGCGSGGNLIPMAYALPHSSFMGVDLAAEPVADGMSTIQDLGLENVVLHSRDLREVGPEAGQFDYIVAHGVYSWVPEEVREGLLAVCRACLAPEGIAYVSFNSFPGGHVRQMLREMMLHHVRNTEDAAERIRQAREFLGTLLESHHWPKAWGEMRDHEVKAMLKWNDGSLYHDELAPFNQRFYLHEFAAAAQRHQLQYLGEAEPHEMFDPSRGMDGLAGDVLERVEHLDFLKARRFHQALVCRAERSLNRSIAAQQMPGFLFSSCARREDDGKIAGLRGVRITAADEVNSAVALALGEVYPLPLTFNELVPYVGNEEALCEILFALAITGFADLHVYHFPCEERVSDRPRASRLARYQAARSPFVTTARHGAVELDEIGRRLVQLADGTRTQAEIAAALGAEMELDRVVSGLKWMASRALLEG